jgi:hypothetical protein
MMEAGGLRKRKKVDNKSAAVSRKPVIYVDFYSF